MSTPKVLLITGPPGSGKTTLIRGVVQALGVAAGGFYTQEVRTGFRIVTLDGREDLLAGVGVGGPYRVGRYGVNLAGIDCTAVPALERAIAAAKLIVVDEIGRMELYSERFREAVLAALASGKPLLGTIMLAAHPWAVALKRRPDVRLLHLSVANREEVQRELVAALRRLLGSKRRHFCPFAAPLV
ncbi:MAG: nucleoside-triphosphatase [Dehalococcoidia bacterium]